MQLTVEPFPLIPCRLSHRSPVPVGPGYVDPEPELPGGPSGQGEGIEQTSSSARPEPAEGQARIGTVGDRETDLGSHTDPNERPGHVGTASLLRKREDRNLGIVRALRTPARLDHLEGQGEGASLEGAGGTRVVVGECLDGVW